MFHRRLILLAGAVLAACFPLAAQMFRLAIVQGEEHLAAATGRLVRQAWSPTVRGRILDRHGRVLAMDRPAFALAIDYDVLSGDWAARRAREVARELAPADWSRLDDGHRQALVEQARRALGAHVEREMAHLADRAGIDRASLADAAEGVIRRVEQTRSRLAARRREAELARFADRGQTLTPRLEAQIERRAWQPIAEQRSPHVVIERVEDERAFGILRAADQRVPLAVGGAAVLVEALPGVRLVDASTREHPHATMTVDVDLRSLPGPLRAEGRASITVHNVASHVIGRMKPRAQREDIDARSRLLSQDDDLAHRAILQLPGAARFDRGAYRPGDPAGLTGIERSSEHRLRGLRGLRLQRLDTGQTRDFDPEPGRDVRLTIDAALQSRVQAALDPALGLAQVQDWHAHPALDPGTPLFGAAVVLEISSGDILALVSTPAYPLDPARDEAPEPGNESLPSPYVNRAVASPYPPGSIVKPLVFAWGASRGGIGLDERIDCTGHLLPDRPQGPYRCWVFRQHQTTHTAQLGHHLAGPEAIMVSCNIFFYTLGRRLGPDGLSETFADFGVGEPLALGLDVEEPGWTGYLDRGPDGRRATRPPTPQDAILMGIGQGPVVWTPLHAADAYATLARGGIRVKPRLVLDGRPSPARDVHLDPAAVRAALDGLFQVIHNPRLGTAHHITAGTRPEPIINAPDVWVWGKTGTAQAPPPRPRGASSESAAADEREGDHSWFVLLVGPAGGAPEFVVAVIMERAGSGGRVSGPIANQIVLALIAQGYL